MMEEAYSIVNETNIENSADNTSEVVNVGWYNI
jgi:hypothetical protein